MPHADLEAFNIREREDFSILARSWTALAGPCDSGSLPHGSDRGRLRFAGNVLLLSQVDQLAAESPEGYPL
jgi:hypothetical protein